MNTNFTKEDIIFSKVIKHWCTMPNSEMSLKTGRKVVALKGGDLELKQKFMQYMLKEGIQTGRFEGKHHLDLVMKLSEDNKL